jgi:twitching mobility protein
LYYGRFNGEIISLGEKILDPREAAAITKELFGAKFDEFMEKRT